MNEEKELWEIAHDAYINNTTTASQDWKAVVQAVIAEHERRKALIGLAEVAAAMDERNRPDPNAECKEAFAAGKRIQVRSVFYPDYGWGLTKNPLWANTHEYRVHPDDIKPEWKLPDPPDGEAWHRTDWTQDMLPEGCRPLLLGEVNVPGVDERECGGMRSGEWLPLSSVEASKPGHPHLRTTRPLPVKPDPFAAEKAAFAAGKVIQFKHSPEYEWADCQGAPPQWYHDSIYRVKPDPVPYADKSSGQIVDLVESILKILKSQQP